MSIFKFRNPFKKQDAINRKDMYDCVLTVERDKKGNYIYLSNYIPLNSTKNNRFDFDMSNDKDKDAALRLCPPFSTVMDKCGSMFSNGRFYVQDKDGNEKETPDYRKIRTLLRRPNLLQSGRQFNKEVEICLKTFGRCPVYLFRATRKSIPESMWIIPPSLLHQETTGKLWNQTDINEIIGRAYIEWGGEKIVLEDWEYVVISESTARIDASASEIKYRSITDSLSTPVNNWMAQMAARGNLIINGGPKGILCNDDKSDFGNYTLDKEEEEELNRTFKNKYGIAGKKLPILVTRKASLKWIPLSYNTQQLMLHEESKSCREDICNAIGLNSNIFVSNSTYDNYENAKKAAYQDLIIPDAENYTEALASAICPEGIYIKLDYTHIDCMQQDKQASANALDSAANALTKLIGDNVITPAEARTEIASYIDINPDNPKGDFKNTGNEQFGEE
ncbi:MAG: phage portal protein [Bacteroidales bacterium]|nr:phage portal protein [Bacteroidales bacterium]